MGYKRSCFCDDVRARREVGRTKRRRRKWCAHICVSSFLVYVEEVGGWMKYMNSANVIFSFAEEVRGQPIIDGPASKAGIKPNVRKMVINSNLVNTATERRGVNTPRHLSYRPCDPPQELGFGRPSGGRSQAQYPQDS